MLQSLESTFAMLNSQQLRKFVTLWQVYRSPQITSRKVTGFELRESTARESEIKPPLRVRLSAGPEATDPMGAALASKPMGDFASLAVFNLTGVYGCATQTLLFLLFISFTEFQSNR